MKVVILAAGANNPRRFKNTREVGIRFPVFAKPKCLYSYHGKVQLQRVLEDVRQLGLEERTRIVVGYKSDHIRAFVRDHGFKVELVENPRYRESALYSVIAGLHGVDEDVLLLFADEGLKLQTLRGLIRTEGRLGFLLTKHFPYNCVNALKIGREALALFRDRRYLSDEFLADVRRFMTDHAGRPLTGDTPPPIGLGIGSGWALGFICLDIIRRVGKLDKVTTPIISGGDLSPVPFDDSVDYVNDLDRFDQTDEYRDSALLRLGFLLERIARHTCVSVRHPLTARS